MFANFHNIKEYLQQFAQPFNIILISDTSKRSPSCENTKHVELIAIKRYLIMQENLLKETRMAKKKADEWSIGEKTVRIDFRKT